MMRGIRGSNTQPELQVRKALHARGFRYRLNAKELPGSPDERIDVLRPITKRRGRTQRPGNNQSYSLHLFLSFIKSFHDR